MPIVQRQLEPVPFTSVIFEDAFWAPRVEVNRTVTIPHIYQQCEATGRISAFDLNFQRPVPSPIVLIFGDSDPAKWIEAASYSLATHPDPALAALVDSVADKVIHAQQPDGYLNTHFIVAQPEMRWKNLRDWHEMYCAGHLMEAAVAHYHATGTRKLLDALCRYAEYRMEMPIRAIWAHPAVRDLLGRVVLERGPIVYCLEGVDHKGILLDRITIDPHNVSNEFQVEHDENLLGGISVLRGKGTMVNESGWGNVLYRDQGPSSRSVDIRAIPYYAWENRAAGEMRVWLRAKGG